jgi:hypothetical protein
LQGAEKRPDGTYYIENDEAYLVTQWLEKGVFRALEQEYISSMIFAIYCKHPKTGEDTLVETYDFRLTYQDKSKPARFNEAELHSKESVKLQAAKFIRQLMEFVATLDQLPEERWITLQLQVRSTE